MGALARIQTSSLVWLGLFGATWLLATYSKDWATALDMAWLSTYPKAWVFPLKDYVSAMMQWLVEDASFGLFTFTQATRALDRKSVV